MDYTPFDETTFTDGAVLAGDTAPWSSFPGRKAPDPEVLHYRGVVMNTLTGAVLVHGRAAQLGVREREFLATLMRRAGQIVSPKWLASQIHATIEEVDALAASLTVALREVGAQCLPRHVEGLGYVLWR